MAMRWTAGLTSLLLLVGAGCNNKPQMVDSSTGAPRAVEAAEEMVAMSHSPVADVPVPVGYDLDEGKSRSFAAAGARYIDHLYKGGGDKFTAVRFYKRQMPANRWALVTDMFVQGDIVLDYEKDTERCRIVVTDSHNIFAPVEVKVQLWTSGRIEQPATNYRSR